MKSAYIERSSGANGAQRPNSGAWALNYDLEGVDRIVVGMGPGSFAGVRSAIAFAQGCALGRKGLEVYGLPSPCAALAEFLKRNHDCEGKKITIIGDARQGKYWVARFEGYKLKGKVEVEDEVEAEGAEVVITTDDTRIGEKLKGWFGERYHGGIEATDEGLEIYALKCPEMLIKEPLPLYLNPAVRN